jgi:hypothetical protein
MQWRTACGSLEHLMQEQQQQHRQQQQQQHKQK